MGRDKPPSPEGHVHEEAQPSLEEQVACEPRYWKRAYRLQEPKAHSHKEAGETHSCFWAQFSILQLLSHSNRNTTRGHLCIQNSSVGSHAAVHSSGSQSLEMVLERASKPSKELCCLMQDSARNILLMDRNLQDSTTYEQNRPGNKGFVLLLRFRK